MIAAKIKAARQRAGMTQAQLAAELGTHQSAIARIEAGRHTPSIHMLERIAAALGCELYVELCPR